ncbi:MAG: ABC transporter permease [Spirulinaceae cyanobacterium RM2_2_10]|nr:ABC transporter permease [Spirulinaceae cyanobacterium SM2_1_0]NJO19778.1 ABC transporter permease [Spirulinaceae cyanobacterium RM2_2_10]
MTIASRQGIDWPGIRRYWDLLYVLAARHLKVRYRGSFLGIYWSLLNPLIMTGLYTAIFGSVFASYYDNSVLNYVLAAFTGLVVLNFYAAATTQSVIMVVWSGALLNKIRLPVSVFPLSMVAANVFQFSVGVFPLLALVTLLISHNPLNVILLAFPILSLILVCLGVAFFVSALYVFFRDLHYFYEVVVFVLGLSTPIFYPAAIVPDNIKRILVFNPLYPILESLRQIVLSGEMPEFYLVAHALLNGLLIATIGWLFFRSWRSEFMDLL